MEKDPLPDGQTDLFLFPFTLKSAGVNSCFYLRILPSLQMV